MLQSWRSYESHNALGAANLLLWSYLADFSWRGTELEREMFTQIAEVKLPIFSLGSLLRAAHFSVVKCQRFAYLITPSNGCGALFRVPFLLIEEGFSFGILRPLDLMDGDPVLDFVAIARFCEVDWTALGD